MVLKRLNFFGVYETHSNEHLKKPKDSKLKKMTPMVNTHPEERKGKNERQKKKKITINIEIIKYRLATFKIISRKH